MQKIVASLFLIAPSLMPLCRWTGGVFLAGAVFMTSGLAAELRLAWDAPTPSDGLTYRLYAHTNSLSSGTNLTTALVKVSTGTNLTATAQILQSGTWFFVATALAPDGSESPPSNQVIEQVQGAPLAPQNMRRVTIQGSPILSLTNTWTDVFFMRLKLE